MLPMAWPHIFIPVLPHDMLNICWYVVVPIFCLMLRFIAIQRCLNLSRLQLFLQALMLLAELEFQASCCQTTFCLRLQTTVSFFYLFPPNNAGMTIKLVIACQHSLSGNPDVCLFLDWLILILITQRPHALRGGHPFGILGRAAAATHGGGQLVCGSHALVSLGDVLISVHSLELCVPALCASFVFCLSS